MLRVASTIIVRVYIESGCHQMQKSYKIELSNEIIGDINLIIEDSRDAIIELVASQMSKQIPKYEELRIKSCDVGEILEKTMNACEANLFSDYESIVHDIYALECEMFYNLGPDVGKSGLEFDLINI